MWWMLAGVAIQAAQSIGAAKGQAKLDKIENQRIEAYNKQVSLQRAKSFNEIAIQKAVLADQTAQAYVATQQQGQQVKSARGLQSAGTDTMGASVDQNLADVDMKVADAQYTIGYNAQITDDSLNAAIQAAGDNSVFSMRSEKHVASTANIWGSALGNAAASIAMSAAENKARTGSFTGKTVSRNQGIDI